MYAILSVSLSAAILHLGSQAVMKGRQRKEKTERKTWETNNQGSEARAWTGRQEGARCGARKRARSGRGGRHFVIFARSKREVWQAVGKTSLSASWNNRKKGGGGGLILETTLLTLQVLIRHGKQGHILVYCALCWELKRGHTAHLSLLTREVFRIGQIE